MGSTNSAIEQSSLPDPNQTFDTELPIVNQSNEDAKKVRYNGLKDHQDHFGLRLKLMAK